MGYFDAYYNTFTPYGMTNPSVPFVSTFSMPQTPISFNSTPLPIQAAAPVTIPTPAVPVASTQGFSFSNVFAAANRIASRIISSVNSSISRTGSSFVSSISNGVQHFASSISNFGQSMVAKARSFLGYNERNGSYKLFTQGRTEAWCADFVSYVARQCGKVGFNFPSVSGLLSWGRKNGRFSTTPTVGDAIIFKGAGASHTGIVTRVSNGRVYTIEGNTSDKVAERSYSLSDRRITGFVTIA